MCVDSSRKYSVYECVYACDYMPSPWTMNTNTHYLAEVEVSHMQVKLKSLSPPPAGKLLQSGSGQARHMRL